MGNDWKLRYKEKEDMRNTKAKAIRRLAKNYAAEHKSDVTPQQERKVYRTLKKQYTSGTLHSDLYRIIPLFEGGMSL